MSQLEQELSEKYKEVIRKNLPEAVGEELRIVLEEAARNKAKVVEMMAREKELRQQMSDLADTGAKLKAVAQGFDDREKAVTQREEAVFKRERDLELELLKKEVACANKERDTVFKLTETVFKNQTVRENVFGSMPVMMPAYNGCGPWTQSAPFNATTEKTVGEQP